MPRSRAAFRTRSRRGPLTATRIVSAGVAGFLLLAGAALQACFAPSSLDEEFTRPEGEVFISAQAEIAADGDLIIAAQVGMLYGYEGDDPYHQGKRIARNYHTVLYRRSEGAWSATPMRNVQKEPGTFPVLLPSPHLYPQDGQAGDVQVLVQDGASIYAYGLAGNGRSRRPAPEVQARLRGYVTRDASQRPVEMTLRDDSTLMFLDFQREFNWGDAPRPFAVENGGPGGSRLVLDTSGRFAPWAFRVFGDLAVLAGQEYQAPGREPVFGESVRGDFVCYSWRLGDSTARRTALPNQEYHSAYFAQGLGTPRLVVLSRLGFATFELDEHGVPGQGRWAHAADTSRGYSVHPASVLDRDGCLHLAAERPVPHPRDPRILDLTNTCAPGARDSLRIERRGTGLQGGLHVQTLFRLTPAGAPVLVILAKEYGGDGSAYHPSRILLAEKRESGWTVETLAEK